MLSPPPDASAPRRCWSRRSVLALTLALGGAGCTLSDPAVRGQGPVTGPSGAGGNRTGTPSSGPSASAGPGRATAGAAAAARELRLAALAASVRGGPAERRRMVELVRRTHLERAAALAAPDPGSRPGLPASTSGTPGPAGTPGSGGSAGALERLVEAEGEAARQHRSAALAADGLSALLLGSMSVASLRFARALAADESPAADRRRVHRPMALVSDTEAWAAMVSSLHALVYGYQQAIGRLELGSAAYKRAVAGLRKRRRLLDRLTDTLVAVGAEVPAAEPAYVPRPQPTNSDTARQLLARIESALLPFCGLWLAAAARPSDRRLALDTLSDVAATAESWGAPVLAWPGWRD